MKVLHLISGGDTGGAKTHIISLVKGLSKYADIKIVCFIEDTFFEDARNEGIDIEVYKQRNRSDFAVVNRLAKLVNDEGFDIVHCHGARANFIAMFLRRKIDKPMITTVHSDYKLDFKDNLYKRIIFTSLNTLALKKFDNFLAVSDSFKEMLISRGFNKDNIFVVYNGIDFKEDLSYASKEEFLSRYKIEHKGKNIVGILARLDKVKDHETFIKAANEVLKKEDNTIFLIAGDGNNLNKLKQEVKNLGLEKNVFFLGFIKDPDSFINSIDINILTSISESFPYVILEGARMSKPMISTNVGGISKLVKDGHNGYIINVGDYNTLADRIEELVNNKSKLREMGENLYKDARENFSYDSMAKTHLDIYRALMNTER